MVIDLEEKEIELLWILVKDYFDPEDEIESEEKKILLEKLVRN